MGLPNIAKEAVAELNEKVANFQTSAFFRENIEYDYLIEGARAMVGFLQDRPAMLLTDAQNMDGILSFINKEWYEAEHEITVEHQDELFKELGDTVFFALLSGILHWEEMDDSQRDFVKRAIDWSSKEAERVGVSINEAVVYVATKKDPTNYRREFYQLIDGEKTENVPGRVIPIGKLHRKIREKLNGEWGQANDLLRALANHWLVNSEGSDITVAQIETMFELAGLDLIAILES